MPGHAESLAFNETNPRFGAVSVGHTGARKAIVLSNINDAPLVLENVSASDDFTQTNNCPIWIPEGDGCVVLVTFAPRTTGLHAGHLRVKAVGSSEQDLQLSGLAFESSTAGQTNPSMERSFNDEEKAQELLNDSRGSPLNHPCYVGRR